MTFSAHATHSLLCIFLPNGAICYTRFMHQKDALRILTSGRNVFLTGAAGSGKTHLLRAFLRWADSELKTVAVTASTGIAATHMGGMTIHAWAGIGIYDSLSDTQVERIAYEKKLNKRFNDTNILIIDEISMLHYSRLDMVDAILRKARNDMRPFGGIQIVCSGDFFQLPPIVRDEVGLQAPFAFRANSWRNAKFAVCYLAEQFRQTESVMTRILNEIRAGEVSDDSREALMERIGVKHAKGSITKLYAQNLDVDKINAHHLAEIEGEMHAFPMWSTGPSHLVISLKKSCLAPETLHLKVNARVMFVRNDVMGRWVNGTTGVIESFDAMGAPVVRKSDGRVVSPEEETWNISDGEKTLATITQYPLRLAWAITIHKSQGMSLDAAEIDLRNAFVKGMGYVALSRVRTIDGLSLVGINNMALAIDEEVQRVDLEFRELSDDNCDAAEALTSPSDEEIIKLLEGASRREAQQKSGLRSGQRSETKERSARKEHAHKMPKPPKDEKQKSHLITRDLLSQNKTPKEIAMLRALTPVTIIEHIEQCIAEGLSVNAALLESLLPPARLLAIAYAIDAEGDEKLGPIKQALPEDYTWDEVKLGRCILRAKK